MRGFVKAAALGLAVLAAAPAAAEPMDAAKARAMLFAPSGMMFYAIEPTGLDDEAAAKVAALQEGMAERMDAFEQGGYGYYGAMAVPTGVALTPESLVVVAGLHSAGAAQIAAVDECRKAHGGACAAVGLMLPNKYEARDFTLSAAATAGVEAAFGSGEGPQYLAQSVTTAGFAVAKGQGADAAALKACNEASAGRNDCVIALVEE
jgi:hypothetical protein